MEARKAHGARRGFSVVEVLIVITMIGILTGISAPYVIKDSPSVKAGSAAETLAQAMRLARFRAVAMNREVYFQFQPNGAANFYTAYANLGDPASTPTGTSAEVTATRIEFSDMAGSLRGTKLATDVAFAVGNATAAPYGGSVTSALDLPVNPFVFDPRGAIQWPANAASSMGAVYIRHSKDPASVRAVTVSSAGLIKVWRLKGGTWQ